MENKEKTKRPQAPKFTLKDFQKRFPNEDACLDFIFNKRFGDLEACPSCETPTKFHRIAGRKVYSCQWCGYQISPTAGTIMHKSRTPLVSWLFAILLFSNSKNGVSAKELQRQIGVTYKCAFRIGHLIRSMMDEGKDIIMEGKVEMDESLFGGKKVAKRSGKRGWGADRPCVFGMVERGGRIYTQVVDDRKAKTLLPIITAHTTEEVEAYTDEYKAYNKLHKEVDKHFVIQHCTGKHVDGPNGEIHTQTIDGAWSLRKRSIRGTYTSVSPKHLQKYLNEFDFRHNHRHERMFEVLAAKI
jgi:transposase-like protein